MQRLVVSVWNGSLQQLWNAQLLNERLRKNLRNMKRSGTLCEVEIFSARSRSEAEAADVKAAVEEVLRVEAERNAGPDRQRVGRKLLAASIFHRTRAACAEAAEQNVAVTALVEATARVDTERIAVFDCSRTEQNTGSLLKPWTGWPLRKLHVLRSAGLLVWRPKVLESLIASGWKKERCRSSEATSCCKGGC